MPERDFIKKLKPGMIPGFFNEANFLNYSLSVGWEKELPEWIKKP